MNPEGVINALLLVALTTTLGAIFGAALIGLAVGLAIVLLAQIL